MEASFVPQSNHGTMDDQEEDELGSMSSSSLSDDDDGDVDDDEEEEEGEHGHGSGCSSSSDDSNSSSSLEGPLFEMSSLISQLPFKRGLSMHFEGKSQSFASLSSVKNLEDLVKPERPFRRTNQVRIKSSKSYGWGLATTTTTSHNKKLSPRGSSRTITKKSYSTGTSKRTTSSSFLGIWKQ